LFIILWKELIKDRNLWSSHKTEIMKGTDYTDVKYKYCFDISLFFLFVKMDKSI
jgi:hypothetical protein